MISDPTGCEAAKNIATEFISGRPYDRIGLVVFSGESFTQCPLTTDHAVLINLLREIQSGMIEDGTAIGMGLATAVNRIKTQKQKAKLLFFLQMVSITGAKLLLQLLQVLQKLLA